MDIKIGEQEASAIEREAIDQHLGAPDSAWRGATRDAEAHHLARGVGEPGALRHQLLPALHAVNDALGWISPGAVNYIALRLDVAPADVYGVATFYGLFATTERAGRQVHVCVDLACQIARPTSSNELAHIDGVHESPCLGLCERAPAVFVVDPGAPAQQAVIAPATPVQVRAAVSGAPIEPEAAAEIAVPQVADESLRPASGLSLLRRVGVVDPTSLDSYRSHGGYQALRRALAIGPVGVIREVTEAGLSGRGGAAFPTGRKWDTVARQPARPHYLVCNADESEPGTFKDRVVMESDPFSLVEACTIAAYATGCTMGYIYLRGEYPRARQRLEHAIQQAYAKGLLGNDILGSGFDFDLTVFLGAGAYICGEETAIFNSIEGFRGEPRNKPPFPVEVGLFGKPTLVNNVETLINQLPILLQGAAAYTQLGTSGSPGTKLFCLSGAVQRPGVYEVEFGATLRDLINLAGGLPEGRSLQAVLLGGSAGVFASPDELDVPLTLEGARAAGLTLGSGVVMVLDDTVSLPHYVQRIADFFRDESCGQCVPCRVGTVRQQEALQKLAVGADDDRLALLADIGKVMRDASICGLGQTAHNAIESAIVKLKVYQ
jgi:NADH-quinone oxidoreductase subunit F